MGADTSPPYPICSRHSRRVFVVTKRFPPDDFFPLFKKHSTLSPSASSPAQAHPSSSSARVYLNFASSSAAEART